MMMSYNGTELDSLSSILKEKFHEEKKNLSI